MKVYELNDYTRGWFIGDFEPHVLRTSKFEVGLLTHKKGDYHAPHIHQIAEEINVLVKGKMKICDQEIKKGQIFVIEKGELAAPKFLEDCVVLVVKVPSVPDDKIIVLQDKVMNV